MIALIIAPPNYHYHLPINLPTTCSCSVGGGGSVSVVSFGLRAGQVKNVHCDPCIIILYVVLVWSWGLGLGQRRRVRQMRRQLGLHRPCLFRCALGSAVTDCRRRSSLLPPIAATDRPNYCPRSFARRHEVKDTLLRVQVQWIHAKELGRAYWIAKVQASNVKPAHPAL